jgi:hypothetical protein
MDSQGNVHLVFMPWAGTFYVQYMRFEAASGTWSDPVTIPSSDQVYQNFGRPKVDVGPDGIPHVVWCNIHTFPDYNRPMDLMYARANSPDGSSWYVQNLDAGWVAYPDVAVDSNSNPHFTFVRVNEGDPTYWIVKYRDPSGGEMSFGTTQNEWENPTHTFIEHSGSHIYITWVQGAGDRAHVKGVSSTNWGSTLTLASAAYSGWYAAYPNMQMTNRGVPGVVFFGQDWTAGSIGIQRGVFYMEWDWGYYEQVAGGDAQVIEEGIENWDWYPGLGYDAWGTRFVGWTYHDPSKDACYYKIGQGGVVELPGAGDVTMASGPSGVVMIRSVPSGSQLIATWLSSEPVFYPPTAQIDDIDPDTAYTGVHDVYFSGSAWDNDEGGGTIVAYQWLSDMDGVLGQVEDLTLPASSLSIGTHAITFRAQDNEGDWGEDYGTLVVVSGDAIPGAVTNLQAFDTPNDQGGSITLTWTKSADDGGGENDVAHYRIERRPEDDLQFSPIAQLQPGTEQYADTTTQDSTGYYYRVATVDSAAQEGISRPEGPVMSLDDLVSPPSDLAAADVPDDQGGRIRLDWTLSAEDGAGVDDVVAYLVSRAEAGDTSYTQIDSLPAGSATYDDSMAVNLVVYSYVVTAVDDAGNTAASGGASAVPHDNVAPAPPADVQGQNIGGEGWAFISWELSVDDTVGGVDDVVWYVLRRSTTSGTGYTDIDSVPGGSLYYVDLSAPQGDTLYYVVAALDAENVSDNSEETSILAVGASDPAAAAMPSRLMLARVGPNPVSDELRVTYGIPTTADVALTLRNVRGQTVSVLTAGVREAGYHTVVWNVHGGDTPAEPGVMFVVLESGHQRLVRRVVLAR